MLKCVNVAISYQTQNTLYLAIGRRISIFTAFRGNLRQTYYFMFETWLPLELECSNFANSVSWHYRWDIIGIYQSIKCRILTGCHEFGRKSKDVIPEKPEMCLKSPQVLVLQSKRNVWIVIKFFRAFQSCRHHESLLKRNRLQLKG